MSNILIADNGAHTIKIGFATDSEPKLIPNCVTKVKSERRRAFIGDQMEECKDYSGLYYMLAFDKGYVVDWELQRKIWDYVFKTKLKVDFSETTLVITEPCFNFKPIQENMTEILYEEYGFSSLLRTTASQLASRKYMAENNAICSLIVDSGYSFTYVVPFVKDKVVKESIKRIDVGGKALTNHLKDIISYRQLNVAEETYVMNQVKEDCCYVSTQFWKDIELAKVKSNPLIRYYVLPDYTHLKRGHIYDPNTADTSLKTDHQSIRMNNERFQVPEILFYPSDVGIEQIGVSHTIADSIQSASEEVQSHLYENIVLIGGNACFPGIKERVYNDVRSMAYHLYDINVTVPSNPITYVWDAGKQLTQNTDIFNKLCISKKEYEEQGINYCIEKFDV